ncbi:transcriptional regulator [Planotetraspora thailandica]|uniref:Transcriptional regulator n=1 Tax=Planotetraspora thailandica TaxID=487172 RepID=A0A8J3UW10_9ACTN|nr:helix-turn-helix transcriptional regulator [Planotetraspora thailandica]GII52427.1 transcriptional regulator [Planotetraspora thailandica]
MPAPVNNQLGEFLRAHRARIDPADVGLPSGGDRRVAGLRREEVAVLAGVSVDYYARLEQGRERNPSPSILSAIGQALRLDADARGHLFRLAGLHPRLAPRNPREPVHPTLLHMLDTFPASAAYVLSPAFDVLAANNLAATLLSPFSGMTNMVRILFHHPQARTVFADWPVLRENVVHALRLNAGCFPGDPEIERLVDELRQSSPDFRSLWEDQTVRGLNRMFKVFVHPEAGRIELNYQIFDVRDVPGQQLLVGTPEPGTRSAEAVAHLASVHATP